MADLAARARELDTQHAATDRRSTFHLPDGLVYLDGNSLGPLGVGAEEAITDAVRRQWGEQLIRAWNESDWWGAPERIGDRIGALVGAVRGQVVVTDSTSVNLFKAVVAASRLRPGRSTVLTDPDSFPTDLYITQSAADLLGLTVELVPVGEAPTRIAELGDSLALASYSQVDYRTGELWDLPALTRAAHDVGALACWDLCHSAGVLDVGLDDGGPTSPWAAATSTSAAGPARPRSCTSRNGTSLGSTRRWPAGTATPPPSRCPASTPPPPTITRARVGTAPMLSVLALEGALTAYDGLSVGQVRARSLSLTGFFLECLDVLGIDLPVATPREDARRGSQVGLRHPDAYAVVQALIARGVIGDFREPDIVRLGFAPLYLSHADVLAAAQHLEQVLARREFEREDYRTRAAVT